MKACRTCGMYQPDRAASCGTCGKPLSHDVVCARCAGLIPSGRGYAAYSGVTQKTGPNHQLSISTNLAADMIGESQLGIVVYCDDCAKTLFSMELWKDAKPLSVEMDLEDLDSPEGKKARSEVIDFSIAFHAMRRSVSPVQARATGRELADLWWRDKEKARRSAEKGILRRRSLVVKRLVRVLLLIALGIAVVLNGFIAPGMLGLHPLLTTPVGFLVVGFGLWWVLLRRPKTLKTGVIATLNSSPSDISETSFAVWIDRSMADRLKVDLSNPTPFDWMGLLGLGLKALTAPAYRPVMLRIKGDTFSLASDKVVPIALNRVRLFEPKLSPKKKSTVVLSLLLSGLLAGALLGVVLMKLVLSESHEQFSGAYLLIPAFSGILGFGFVTIFVEKYAENVDDKSAFEFAVIEGGETRWLRCYSERAETSGILKALESRQIQVQRAQRDKAS